MAVTVFQDAKGQAIGAVKVVKSLVEKQKTETYNWIPYEVVTKENYLSFTEKNKK